MIGLDLETKKKIYFTKEKDRVNIVYDFET